MPTSKIFANLLICLVCIRLLRLSTPTHHQLSFYIKVKEQPGKKTRSPTFQDHTNSPGVFTNLCVLHCVGTEEKDKPRYCKPVCFFTLLFVFNRLAGAVRLCETYKRKKAPDNRGFRKSGFSVSEHCFVSSNPTQAGQCFVQCLVFLCEAKTYDLVVLVKLFGLCIKRRYRNHRDTMFFGQPLCKFALWQI